MKTQTLLPNLLTLTAVAALSGWATTGYQQADKTGAGIAEFREEIVHSKRAVDATLTALDHVAISDTTDPRKAFECYSKNLAALDAHPPTARL